MKTIFVALFVLFLGGCSATQYLSQQDIKQVVLNRCPPLVNYSQEQQRMAAEELRKLYSDSQIAVMITDYSKLRDACRIVTKRVNKRIRDKK
jgi:uncharacterized protein YcfL